MKKPIIHGYFLCWNEEYILPHLLKHYNNFCDNIFILDNYSDDNSYNIIKKFKNENGNKIKLLAFDSKKQYRDDIFLNMANNIWKKYSRNKADYVIFADADEFICHNDINNFLIEKFNENYTIFITKGYHMVADKELILNENDNIFEKVNMGLYDKIINKPIIFNPNKILEINFCVGRHFCNPIGNIKFYESNGDLKLKHFKYLGINNFLFKVEKYQKRFSDINKKMGWATYWLENKQYHINDYEEKLKNRLVV